MPDKNATIALYEHVPARVVGGKRTPDTTRLIEVRSLDAPRADLLRRRNWREALAAALQSEGWKIHALSVTADATGPDLVVYLERPDPSTAPARRRPVTRGGRPIGEPDLTKPTMAARMRQQRGGGR
jgi:hypothetical protein